MSKKNADREKEEKKKAAEEEEEDLEQEEEDREEDEEEDDDEEDDEDEEPAAAQPVEARRARARRDDDHGHGHDHDHDHDDEGSDADDPYWWTPHAVMGALVLIGVLGFFGVFNKILGGLAAKPAGGGHDAPAATTAEAAHQVPGAHQPAPTPGAKPAVPEDVAAAPASAQKTASGLAYRVLKKGTSTQSPKDTDQVTVHYSGWTTDGKMFDSSVTRGQPATFPLKGVIKGWTEGVQLMHVGDTTRFWIPANLAYGEKPARPGAPSGMLVFDIELIAIK